MNEGLMNDEGWMMNDEGWRMTLCLTNQDCYREFWELTKIYVNIFKTFLETLIQIIQMNIAQNLHKIWWWRMNDEGWRMTLCLTNQDCYGEFWELTKIYVNIFKTFLETLIQIIQMNIAQNLHKIWWWFHSNKRISVMWLSFVSHKELQSSLSTPLLSSELKLSKWRMFIWKPKLW